MFILVFSSLCGMQTQYNRVRGPKVTLRRCRTIYSPSRCYEGGSLDAYILGHRLQHPRMPVTLTDVPFDQEEHTLKYFEVL